MNTLQERLKALSLNEEKFVDSKASQLLPLLALLLGTMLVLLIAGPWGNFPSNDDRLYAYGVKSIVETGNFSIRCSNAFDFIPIMVGAVVCKLSGFSYDALRWTTIAFHLFGITGLYLALREFKIKGMDSALICAVYAANPFMINLALSFMTDVPALALTNWALYASIFAINRKGVSHWLLAVLFLTASMAVRQTALVVLPAIVLVGLISLKKNQDRLLLLSSLLIPLMSYFSLQKWLLDATEYIEGYSSFAGQIQNSFLSFAASPLKIVNLIAQGLCYIGLALIPVTLALALCALRSIDSKRALLLAGLASILFVALPLACLQYQGAYMPYSLNLFMPPILGAYCLIGGVPFWRYEHLKVFTYFADFAAVISGFCIVFSVLKQTKLSEALPDEGARSIRIFCVTLLACVSAGLVIQITTSNLDRYYLNALGPLLFCLGPLWRDLSPLRTRIVTLVLVLAIGAYGTIAAMDVMNFSRAQWQAIRQLESTGISPKRIDGGPSYTLDTGGLRLCFAYKMGLGWPEKLRGGKERGNMRWWPVISDDYIIAADTVTGYHAVTKLKYWSPLFWKYRTIYTLKSDKLP